jgi:hypothetical protein
MRVDAGVVEVDEGYYVKSQEAPSRSAVFLQRMEMAGLDGNDASLSLHTQLPTALST